MAETTLDRILTTFAVHLHSTSVCVIGEGWRLAFACSGAVIVHHVLAGSGAVRLGNGVVQPYRPGSIIVVPSRQSHVIGDFCPTAREVAIEDHCGPFADSLVTFAAGEHPNTLLLCGSIPAPHGRALGLFDVLREVIVDVPQEMVVLHAFALMQMEVAAPSLGTAAMLEALMKSCLVVLLRRYLRHEELAASTTLLPRDPRLARVVLTVLEGPGAAHTVASLAEQAGMSRASFADHFVRALGTGPMEFVQSVRLSAAARLFETTDLPVKVVAAAVGYSGPTSLSRAFRGAYGMDPTGYRDFVGNP